MKKGALLIAGFVICVLIAGCSAKAGPSKKPVKDADLLKYVSEQDPIGLLNINYDSVTVEKRKTNTDDGIDKIWVNITGANETDAVEASGIMEFSLYNDGWRFESMSISDQRYRPLAGPKDSVIQDCLGGSFNYYQYSPQSVDLDAGVATCNFRGLIEQKYADEYEIGTASFCYMDTGGYWEYVGMDVTLEGLFWQRIYGIWSGQRVWNDWLGPEKYETFSIRIDDINENNVICQYLIHHELSSDSYDKSDSGTFQFSQSESLLYLSTGDHFEFLGEVSFILTPDKGVFLGSLNLDQTYAIESAASIYESLFSGELDDTIPEGCSVLPGYYSD